MFQLRLLLLAAAMMAWLIQPAHAARPGPDNIVHLAANLISAAALVETVSASNECQQSLHSNYPNSGTDDGSSISLDASVTLVNQDLPSLYLSASTRSVASALQIPMNKIKSLAVKPLEQSRTCRQRMMRFTKEYFYLRDQWDRSLQVIRAVPSGEASLIRQLDAGLIGTSPARKRDVFEHIDALGTQFAHTFSRALADDVFPPALPATIDQKYF